MPYKKQIIAMLLAGGQGSRLYSLTNNVAKPAVSFGGKYRIIDFTLSNCINSQIDTVGVLTQYQPLILNEYIGNGQPWDLDRLNGGVFVLPPYQAKGNSDWYKGTANAIYQNLHFVRRYNPQYVLILSGDHIYNMDYSLMKDFHAASNADITIAAIKVPLNEASRFGIMTADDEGRITAFEEKPKKPKSDLASMGVYIFNFEALEKYLTEDAADPSSSYDFGKNIIPKMLKEGKRMFAYKFSGYWKDVGTLESLWEANMDLLGDTPAFDIFDYSWRIHSRNTMSSTILTGKNCSLKNSISGGGSLIEGSVINSVIGKEVVVEEGAEVIDSVLFEGVKVGRNAKINYCIIDEQAQIGEGACVGSPKTSEKGLTVVARGCRVRENSVVASGTVEEDN